MSLRHDLLICKELIELVYAERKMPYLMKSQCDDENLKFIVNNLIYVIDRYATERSVHSCDIPGCMSCGNPE